MRPRSTGTTSWGTAMEIFPIATSANEQCTAGRNRRALYQPAASAFASRRDLDRHLGCGGRLLLHRQDGRLTASVELHPGRQDGRHRLAEDLARQRGVVVGAVA